MNEGDRIKAFMQLMSWFAERGLVLTQRSTLMFGNPIRGPLLLALIEQYVDAQNAYYLKHLPSRDPSVDDTQAVDDTETSDNTEG